MGMLDYYRPRSRERLVAGQVPAWLANSARRPYIERVLLSMPPWVNVVALRSIQERARWLTVMTGVPHEVDHIVPLASPKVCGLHCSANLQVIPKHVNDSKGNAWWPGMWGQPNTLF